MSNPSIAILGLEGSGKTVFMTVLAKKLSTTFDTECYLDPIGAQTIKHVEGIWATLQQGEWPPSTPPGEMFSLHWKLHIKRNKQHHEADIRLIDLAGQDTRQLFSNDNFWNSPPEHLKPIADYIKNASIVLFVLNIKDYVAEPDVTRRIENQAVIKAALDLLHKTKKVMIIFTQLDQYDEFIKSCGGFENFCRQHLTYIYNAYVGTQKVPTICIAAVNQTQVKIAEDGTALRVPARNFTSRGMEEICRWMVEGICKQYEEELEQEQKSKLQSTDPIACKQYKEELKQKRGCAGLGSFISAVLAEYSAVLAEYLDHKHSNSHP